MQNINKLLRLQKLYIFFISLVLFIIIFSTTFLHAKTFKVSNIEISSPFELNFDKNNVIDDGFNISFYNLITMITTSGDRDKIKNIPLKEIKGMIDSFTISDEKFINNDYFANLETRFNKKKILSFLEKKNIFPSTLIKNNVLLIPVLVNPEQDKVYLFTNNIFYEEWNSNEENYHLLDYLLPSEDLEDLNSIQKLAGSIETFDFGDLISKYDLKDYIISIIYLEKNDVNVLSKINLKDSLKIDNQRYENVDLDNKKDFKKILKSLKNIYENYWKKNNEINTSIKLPITVLINSKEYEKINNLEKMLEEMELVSNFFILNFDNQNTFYKITYNGSPKTFINDASKKNIDLVIENNVWFIK